MKFLLLLVLLQSTLDVTEAGPLYTQDHMTCYHKVVQSLSGVYNTEMIPYAERVVSIQVAENGHYSATACILDYTYGFYRNYVWVSHGCQANFLVCYIRGRNILLICESEVGQRHLCHTHRPIRYLEFVKRLTDSTNCEEGETFGFHGEYIWVANGCKAAFRITTPIGGDAPNFPFV
ncbi:lectin ADEL-like [Haliotis cracherodii]|uniref:lectin ADEL-like n=1 Tax=Haliotis cracherodii TaxID=6455 RepID=UPI0039EC94AA